MKPRVFLVVQPSFSHYREPFVRALLADDRVSIDLSGRYTKNSGRAQDSISVQAASDDLRAEVEHLDRKVIVRNLIWDGGLVRQVLRSSADLYIFEGNVYNLSSWVASYIVRLKRRRVAFWGHGWKREEHGTKLRLRILFYKLAVGHFVYGEWAERFGRSVGLDDQYWRVIFNSMYAAERLEVEREASSERVRSRNEVVLIFSGRLTKRHGVSEAIEAVQRVRRSGDASPRLIIVGDGPEMANLRQLANAESDGIVFQGAVYDFDQLKELYRQADFAISPGASGLNVIQALGFGVPVIAAAGNPESGPEIEAVRHRETGLLFPANDQEHLVRLLRSGKELQRPDAAAMGQRARELVLSRYTAEQHASAMIDGILDIINTESATTGSTNTL